MGAIFARMGLMPELGPKPLVLITCLRLRIIKRR
jgi:hypothetical protein